jgi:N-acetylmuramoyl-L-alanine amidase
VKQSMTVNKAALRRIVTLAVMLAGTASQPLRAEDSATKHTVDNASCARSTFRVLLDVGHTATSPGADSVRGVPEYEFNLIVAEVIAQSLHEAGFDNAIRLITSGTRLTVYSSVRQAQIICTVTCSSPSTMTQCNLKETWEYESKKYSYSDRFSGYAIFVSHDNVDRDGSLVFAHSLGQQLQRRGLHYTPHYTLSLMGRYRHELIDEEAGVYRYDHLIVLHSAHMPAVLLEAGSIVNRQEELELTRPERRLMVAEAVTAAVEEFCASRGQAVVPPSNPASVAVTPHARGIKPASLSRHKRIHSAKT